MPTKQERLELYAHASKIPSVEVEEEDNDGEEDPFADVDELEAEEDEQ